MSLKTIKGLGWNGFTHCWLANPMVLPLDGALDLENVIPWHCQSDVDYVALVQQDSSGNTTRSLKTIAEVRFDSFEANLPDLGVLGHVVEPLKIIKDIDVATKTSCFIDRIVRVILQL